ncbi:MAG: autotransporter domain-containing protein [Bradyrhizobium sp.]|uniref:autotransporter domain-containing protein n=1 Tax=Bradyrhizobium sp. TaxID=376 RepID=UPI001D4B69A7|nr:autotransporter domain-containing protein [Bradyrhizobium sp.]MBV9565942.1 autotransporter domain-containing protein [Bradyrhizobium sp.]
MARSLGARGRKSLLLGGIAGVAWLSAVPAAWAQNCSTTQDPNSRLTIDNIGNLAIPPGAAAAAIAGTIGNVQTAFLAQQGSAFVSAPPSPSPDQPGGGVWARAIGGEVNLKSTSTSASTSTVGGGLVNSSSTTCNNSTHDSFAGVQVGSDISRLNWNGWNVHLGTTAGYLGSKESDNNGFSNDIQVPFLGTYLVATKGRFFADVMFREEFYNIRLNNTPFNFFNQPIGAHGFSISTSAGYNFDLHNGWFAEPSAGFIYSRTSIDSFINPGNAALPIPGLVQTNDVESEIGRLSLRVGRTIETPRIIWQPFASVSVFHEFAGNVVSNYSSLPNGSFLTLNGGAGPTVPSVFSQQTSTSRVGTYGQYSLGVAAQIVNTGWLGFVRGDYRNGDNIDGWTANAGIRYQFTPEMIASVMPVKVKAPPHAYVGPTNWTGFYVGGFAGVADGRTDIRFDGAPSTIAGNRPWVAGGLGGVEAGYNKQFSNNWVVGVEGDIGAANVHGGRTAGTADGLDALGASVGFSPAFFTVEDKTNWMATVTGRVGYAWNRTLFYVKGGAAFEDSSTVVNCIYGPTGSTLTGNGGTRSCLNQAGAVTGGFSTPWYTRVGWTGGFGSEFDLGHNWSAKGEYDFLSFDRHSALATDGTTTLTDRSWVSQVKIGVNYRFSPESIVAKY